MTSAWRRLCGLDGYRITEIPRRHEGENDRGSEAERDPGRAQRVAALVAAYHAGETVAFGWLRERAGGDVQILAAGPALAGSVTGGDVVLALPGGARGRVLGRGALAGAMAGLSCWRAIGGISDGLLGSGDGVAGDRAGVVPSMEECLLPAWGGPFGWMVVAEPVPPGDLLALADDEARRERLATGLADRFPEQDVQARRHRSRHTELRQGLSTGMWRVHLLAGGTGPVAAARIAGLVCASADLQGLPYSLTPAVVADAAMTAAVTVDGEPAVSAASGNRHGPDAGGLRVLLDGTAAASRAGLEESPDDLADLDGDTGPRTPFHASTGLLAALARTPEREIPGIRLTLRPDFDVTQEGTPAASASIPLGQVLDRQRAAAGPLRIPLDSLNRHVFVCGATGGGKSQTVRGLLEAATRAGVPWLVVEPAKAEYRLMATRLAGSAAEVVRIRPGEADAAAAGLNPLEPATDGHGRRFPLQTHADLVRALFLAAFQSEEPFPQVLSAALTRVYEEAGWDLALGEPMRPGLTPGYPGLADLQRTAERVVQGIGYGPEMSADVLGFIKVRLSSLRLGTTGRFLDGGHPIDFGRLLQRNVVLEIEDVGDDRDKAFLMGTVLLRLVEHLRLAGQEAAGLRHLTVFEEAHRLLRRPEPGGGAAAHAVELFAGLLAEIRAYGEGIIIAEQIPARLIADAIKNTAVKIVHRLPAADDREAVGATMNLSAAQSRYLVTLVPGEAAVAVDGMDHPLLARMPDGTAREGRPADGLRNEASPATVAAVRSVTCGAECVASPCTLRDMRAAQRAVEGHPGLALWAELSVLSHLTGWPMPIPAASLLGLLRDAPARLRDCGLSHGVDAAVAARTPLICARVSPPALASHVGTAMRVRVTQGMWMCPEQEPKWLAPAPRPAAGRPDTIVGCDEDPEAVRPLAFGLTGPSAVERAIGTDATSADFEPRLAAYLDQEFIDCRWPLRYLRRKPQ